MNELIKRIYTSVFLISIFLIALYYKAFLLVILIFCTYQIFYELFNLLKNLFIKKKRINLYLLLIFSLVLLFFINISIWININSSNILDKIYLFLLISISITTDIGGYLFGKIFKGKKLTKISPKKTVSGAIGSLILGVLTVFLLFNFFLKEFYIQSILVGLITSLACQLGDLFFSFLKRKAKLKDTGNFLPGHGGILDRLDGIYLGIPIGMISITLLF